MEIQTKQSNRQSRKKMKSEGGELVILLIFKKTIERFLYRRSDICNIYFYIKIL